MCPEGGCVSTRYALGPVSDARSPSPSGCRYWRRGQAHCCKRPGRCRKVYPCQRLREFSPPSEVGFEEPRSSLLGGNPTTVSPAPACHRYRRFHLMYVRGAAESGAFAESGSPAPAGARSASITAPVRPSMEILLKASPVVEDSAAQEGSRTTLATVSALPCERRVIGATPSDQGASLSDRSTACPLSLEGVHGTRCAVGPRSASVSNGNR